MTKLENTNCIKTKFFDKKNIAKQTIAVLLTAINVCTPMMTCAQTNSSVNTSDNTRFQKFKKVKKSFDNFARCGFKEISDFAKKNPKTTGMLTIFGVLSTFGVPVIANNLCDYIENSQKIARDANGIAEHLFGYVHEIFSNIDKNPEKYYELYSENTENLQQKIKLKTKNNSITNFVSLAKYYGFNMDEKIFELTDKKQKLDINIIFQQLINTAPNENLKNAIEKVFSKEKISSFVQQNDLQKTISQLDEAKKVWEAKKQQFEKDLEEYIRKLNEDPTLGLVNEYNSWVLECKQYDIANEDLENAYQNALNSENVKKTTCGIMYESILSELELIPNKISTYVNNHYIYTKQNNNIVITLKNNSDIFNNLFDKVNQVTSKYPDMNFKINTKFSDLKSFLEPNFTGNRVESIFNELTKDDNNLKTNFNEWIRKIDNNKKIRNLHDCLTEKINELSIYFKDNDEADKPFIDFCEALNTIITTLKDSVCKYYTKHNLNDTGKELLRNFIETYLKNNGFTCIDFDVFCNYFYIGTLKLLDPKSQKQVPDDKRVTMLCKYLVNTERSKTTKLSTKLDSISVAASSSNLQVLDNKLFSMIKSVKEMYVDSINGLKNTYPDDCKCCDKDTYSKLCDYIIKFVNNNEKPSLKISNIKSTYYKALDHNEKHALKKYFDKKVLYNTMTKTSGLRKNKKAKSEPELLHFFKIALIANKAYNCNIDLGITKDEQNFKDELRVNEYNDVLKQAKDELRDILK